MIATMANPSLPAHVSVRTDFEASVESDSRRLFSVALAILRNPAEAEDAVQESLLKAWRNWATLRDQDRRSAWLTRICVNHCISSKRRSWLSILTDSHSDTTADPRAQTAFDPADPDLDRAMARLSVKQRAVVVLHYHYGFTFDEVASLLGSRPGTVRSHLNRALTTLRHELSQDRVDGGPAEQQRDHANA